MDFLSQSQPNYDPAITPETSSDRHVLHANPEFELRRPDPEELALSAEAETRMVHELLDQQRQEGVEAAAQKAEALETERELLRGILDDGIAISDVRKARLTRQDVSLAA